jgi:hypothetical protein
MILSIGLWQGKPSSMQRGFRSDKLISLWDIMLTLEAKGFVSTYQQIVALAASLAAMRELPPQMVSEDFPFRGRKSVLCAFHDCLVSMELTASAIAAQRLMDALDSGPLPDTKRLESLLFDLLKRINDELRGKLFFLVPSSRARFYRLNETLLGRDLLDKLPSLNEEAFEAGNCFALGRFTACVFHLMRLMETIVYKFATKLDAPFKVGEDTWGPILERVKTKIEGMPRGLIKKKYSSCYKLLDGVREWRNDLIHRQQNYSEERARDLIGTARLIAETFSMLPDVDPNGSMGLST